MDTVLFKFDALTTPACLNCNLFVQTTEMVSSDRRRSKFRPELVYVLDFSTENAKR